MDCLSCQNQKLYIQELELERDELRLQVLEMAMIASEMKQEVRAYLALLGLPVPESSSP